MQAEIEALKQENLRLRSSKQSASELAHQVQQFQVQLRQKEEDSRLVEDMLKAEVARLTRRCEQMVQQQSEMDEEAMQMESALRTQLKEALENKGNGGASGGVPQDNAYARGLEEQLAQERAKHVQDRHHQEEEKNRIEQSWSRKEFVMKDERDRLRQDRDLLAADKKELETMAKVLQQNTKHLDEKIRNMVSADEAHEGERIGLKMQVQQLEESVRRGREQQASMHESSDNQHELEASALRVETGKMRRELEQLRREKEEADSRCAQLQVSVERLEERQRFYPQRSTGTGGNGGNDGNASVRSSSSRGSSTRFRTTLKGASCLMTADGQTATRTKGCRQCVVLGDGPLEFHAGIGYYFELQINDVVTGWVGGLGIGITMANPMEIGDLPDRAWRIPSSWIAGYWGRMFTDGQQHFIDWKPQDLKVHDKVGFLVSVTGQCAVFVNGEIKVHFDTILVPVEQDGPRQPLALVDVYASTASVSLLTDVSPPENLGLQMAGVGAPNGAAGTPRLVRDADGTVRAAGAGEAGAEVETPRVPRLFLPSR